MSERLNKQGVRNLDPVKQTNARRRTDRMKERKQACAHQWRDTDWAEWPRLGYREICILCEEIR